MPLMVSKILIFVGILFLTPTRIHAWAIYGADDRKDLNQVQDKRLLRMADSTVAIFRRWNVEIDEQHKVVRLVTEPAAKKWNLCEDEPFADQPSGASCSGVLVGPDLIASAGHCVLKGWCEEETFVVFGFTADQSGKAPTKIPAEEVYRCKKILGRKFEEPGEADWVVFQLDRPVQGHEPLNINRGKRSDKGTKLVTTGHPLGMPAKITDGGQVLDPDSSGLFEGSIVADLDGAPASSGSPVFNAETGLIEGLYVRGETDENEWVEDKEKGCRRLKRCAQDECDKVQLTPVCDFADNIPELAPKSSQIEKSGPALSSLKRIANSESW